MKLIFYISLLTLSISGFTQVNVMLNPSFHNPAFAGSKNSHRITLSQRIHKSDLSYDNYFKGIRCGVAFHAADVLNTLVVNNPKFGFSIAPKFNLGEEWTASIGYSLMLEYVGDYNLDRHFFTENKIGISINSEKTVIGATVNFTGIQKYSFEPSIYYDTSLSKQTRGFKHSMINIHASHSIKLNSKINYDPLLLYELAANRYYDFDEDTSFSYGRDMQFSITHFFGGSKFRFGIITGFETDFDVYNNELVYGSLTGVAITTNIRNFSIKGVLQWGYGSNGGHSPPQTTFKSTGLSLSYRFGKKA